MKKSIKIIGPVAIFFIAFLSLKSLSFSPEKITISVKAEFLDADRFQLFYIFTDDERVLNDKSINKRVKGTKGVQEVKFEVPLGEKILTSVRLDLSSANYYQRSILVNSVSFYNGKDKVVINDILSHFEPSKYFTIDKGRFVPHVINDKYDPYLKFNSDKIDLKQLSIVSSRFTLPELTLYSLMITLLFWSLSFFVHGKVTHQIIFNIVFTLITFTPILLGLFNITEKTEQLENRELSSLPDVELSKKFFKKFENHFNDNFPFRNTLIKKGTTLKTNVLGVSPFSKKVRFGKEKFLFTNIHEAYKSYSKTNLLSDSTLKRVVNKLVDRKTFLNKEGKEYYLGYLPNKHTLYQEYLPSSMRNEVRDGESLAQQLKRALQEKDFDFFDPIKELREHKAENLLYHKLDTHWNDYGAFVAYQAFVKNNMNGIPHSKDEFGIYYMERSWGDLTKLIGTDSISGYNEVRPLFKLKDQSRTYKKISAKGYPTGTIRTICEFSGNNKKAIFFGDSFSVYLIQFLSLHFSEVIYVRDSYNQELVNKENPDAVIELMVERFIFKHL